MAEKVLVFIKALVRVAPFAFHSSLTCREQAAVDSAKALRRQFQVLVDSCRV